MMTEQRRSKASELREDLMRHPLTSEELARKYPKVEELRLRSDVPTAEIDNALPVKEVVKRLRSEDVGIVALREPESDTTAVVIPIERYLELAGKELASHSERVGTLDGRIIPVDSAFAASHVAPINPNATWTHGDTTSLK
jgi:hypothetical protein